MNSKKNLKRNLLICLLAGSAVMYTLPLHAATSVIANNTLPTGGKVMAGNITLPNWVNTPDHGKLVMDITQSTTNGVIKWDSFNVGGSATVNFKGPQVEGGYNTLNYVNAGGSMSQIYGTINANNNGNIFIVNPAGVQIGNSAQINVGSLYVSSNTLSDTELSNFYDEAGNTGFTLDGTRNADIELMSLGNINAGKVTFEGDGRIVIDSERLKDVAGTEKLTADKIFVNTKDKNNVVIGYEAYDKTNGYKIVDTDTAIATVNDAAFKKENGYMWVEDIKQLQAINTNLGGNYALRNSIDATATDNGDKGFNPIGLDDSGKVIVNKVDNSDKYGFYGNFDGIDYNIFGLTIDRSDEANVGLFGVAHDANINNVTLVGGSITGGSVVGSVVGAALGNTHITNATNSASVTGNTDVGGIVGYSGDELDNTENGNVGNIKTDAYFTNLINTGSVQSNGEDDGNNGTISNAGGLIGYMYKGTLNGNSYNLGNVSGKGYNVGGLVGHAVNSVIGNPSVVDGKPVENVQVVYNRLDVSGAYNVGGIVGNMEGTTVQNAENSGNVLATGYKTEDYNYHTGETDKSKLPNDASLNNGIASVKVDVANVGGIAGTSSNNSNIQNVTNSGDVSSSKVERQDYYAAGNVGGVVGKAVDTNIDTATNKENSVRGAHNVGGIAGYFGSSKGDETGENVPRYTVTSGINDGGDIMATGARNGNGFVKEQVRPQNGSNEEFIIGNIGGIVGYMDGNNVYVTGSANRGTVHTSEPADPKNVKDWEKAANVGGIVGKIDRSDTKNKNELVKNYENAAVANSYNTGDVLGYTGVGGVVGMMYNGEVAGSYNLGYLRTTRQSTIGGSIDSLNMGGIVGDTTEGSGSVVLYDVYNKGQIGDSEFNYFGRHVGGIVGRLSGTVEKAYNTGAIYNGYNVVGGIAGWMPNGSIENSFNTGNITVVNNNDATSQVGGIVGAASANKDITINNVYNLGTLRSFKPNNNSGDNSIGGIVGSVNGKGGTVSITNAYTTGNIYAGIWGTGDGQYYYDDLRYSEPNNLHIGSIYSENRDGATIKVENTYYIRPQKGLGFTDLYDEADLYNDRDNSNQAIDFSNKSDYDYVFDGGITRPDKTTGVVDENSAWRIYGGNTPILNAFLPKAEEYFDQYDDEDKLNGAGIGSIQYGTAYDPLLTIINAAKGTNELKYNWEDLGINNAAGIAVYGAGLTLDSFRATGATGYFGGTIYADGALNINGVKNDIGIGSAADIYGSAVNIITDGKVTIYGDVTATGNTDNGTTEVIDSSLTVENAGDINIAGSDVDVYGKLTSASDTHGSSVTIPGIEGSAVTWEPGEISNPDVAMSDIADRFAHTTGASAVDGNITITANGTIETDEVIGGNVNLYYGNKGEGLITTGGDLTVTGAGDVYVDSDLNIGGNLTLAGTGAESEVVLDITNIGQVQDKNDNSPDIDNSTEYLHDFLDHFTNTTDNSISFGNTQDAKITVDMWENNKLNLDKFAADFTGKLNTLHITNANGKNAQQLTHIWVSNGDQLKGIQEAAKGNSDILGYNFALKGDINASHVKDYEAIGTGSDTGFTGTFDGRGNRIIGLTVDKVDGKDTAKAGIFDTIGTNGVVKDVNIYSGTFTGTTTAGAVAGVNNGRIEGIVTFGNTVTVTGEDGNAGGIVGVNTSGEFSVVDKETGSTNGGELIGGIYDVESTGSVIAGNSNAIAGGLVGTNNGGLANSFSDSAVTVKVDNQNPVTTTGGLGGVVGVNTEKGNVQYVDSLGVTNGGATNSSNIGGIIGTNNGNMYSGYNESIVSGKDNVGGIIGENSTGGTVTNIVNATSVTGENESADNVSQYVGGLVGSNSGSVTNGRNNGTITGTNYVGGMVGNNADEHSILTNLVNDSSAAIEGERYVGGIAGSNSGTITADKKNDNLINRGSITGNKYVGGVAGENKDGGTIANTLNSVVLHAKGDNAQYFGGVVGQNSGLINGATNTSNINITAVGGTYVGGIIGNNTGSGTLKGEILNQGSVAGKSNVGGIIGLNENASVLQGTAGNRLTVTNEGNVTAEDGGAAGIFYANTGNISYADITNTGTVTGGSETDSVTGGLFGTNSGEITNSTLTNTGIVTGGTVGGLIGNNSGSAANSTFTNSGTVSGNTNVGGLFGTNSGDITKTSLKNEVNGQVIGMNNVGGLIGENTGKIEGGRDDADSYYKYQIYNNGVINVGTWTDNDGDGIVDAGEIQGLAEGATSTNIGGLIGYNKTEIINGVKHTGSLTAGYNTGAINAGESTNVGGIAGSNSGTIDQVFNTIYNTDGTKGAITGGTNVGGLVGTNSGTLSNAYNTTDVSGNYAGNAVGVNSGTISNIYATNTTGQLIGSGYDSNVSYAYSFSANEVSSSNVIVISDQDDQKDSGSYDGFDFSAADVGGAAADWKNYDGYSNPLLKVFLTKAEYTGNESFTYNGQNQGLTISGNVSAADQLNAYNNDSSLLQAAQNKYAGQDYLGIYSQQIAASGNGETFDPNNLGYDIDVTYDIDKATITIKLDEISRDYGNSAINNVTSGGNNYGFNFGDMVLTDEMKAELTADNLGFTQTYDGAVANLKDGQKTNDAGSYNWSADFTLSDALSGNYQFDTKGTDSLTDVKGVSKVNRVNLKIDLKDITRVYGNLDKADYEFIADGLVNGDDIKDLILTVTSDGAIVDGSTDNPLKTNTVGDYEWSATVSNNNNNLNTNYIITIDASAKSSVTPAQLDVVLGDVSHVYGSPNLNGYAASFGNNNGLVNGDNGSISVNVDRVTDAALSTDKQYTNDVDNYHWTVGEGGLSGNGFDLGNYTVHYVDKGNSKVTPAQLDIVLGDVSHVYGSPNLNGYAASFGNNNGLVNGDSGIISVDVDRVTDAALSTDKQYTNDVDNYHWTVGEGGLSADGFKLGNYAINFVKEGSSKVTKANLTININDVNMTYGDLENWISGQYGYNASDVDGQKLVNGDSLADVIAGMTYNNTAYNSDGTTKNVAESNFFLTSDGVTQGTKYGNYNITFNNGTVTMNKKQITIGANDEQILVGETPNYSGTDIDGMLVNGDSLNGNYHYGVEDSSIESVVGTYNGAIGVWIGGSFYDLSNPDWSNLPGMSFFANYNVTFEPGTLTVSAYDIPEDWPHNRWDYLFNDAPFDRNKDFRERKAEVNFVDGGMEI